MNNCLNIKKEKNESKKYCFEMDDKNSTLLKLNLANVGLIEFLIINDSNYIKTGDIESAPKGKYIGSSSYWFSKLKAFYNTGIGNFEDIIEHCIIAVDNENSTHLNADKKQGRNVIKKRIVDFGSENLLNSLENRDFDLFDMLSARTFDNGGRCNLSFASKFCHCACMHLFEGEEAQDNFSIYDNILKKSIPFYAIHYGINFNTNVLTNYRKYSDLIDKIIEYSGSKISRNGFDHLLWYYHKAHPLWK
jgi:hypothetical protein